MSKKSFIDRIGIKEPCSQDWASMKGNERIRFCDHCSKHVNDLTAVTRKEAKKIVRSSGGNICVRYIENPITKEPIYADRLVQIRRRSPIFAAGVVSASLSLSSLTYAQGGLARTESVTLQAPKTVAARNADQDVRDVDPKENRRIVSGSVVDPNGALIPGAQLILTGSKASEIRHTTADGEGGFRFENVLPGKYILQGSASGFSEFTSVVEVPFQSDTSIDVAMSVGTIEIEIEIRADRAIVLGGAISVEYSSSLVRAVANEDIEEVKALLAKGENVDGKKEEEENVDVTSPLAVAVEDNSIEIARLLLGHDANANALDPAKRTPLMMLDEDATAEMVNLLLSYGGSMDLEDEDGNTALILAAENSNAEVVEALLRANPSINEANEEGRTALMQASNEDELEIVTLLLKAGADVNLKDEDGDTALDLTSNYDIEKLLHRYGAKPSEKEVGESEAANG